MNLNGSKRVINVIRRFRDFDILYFLLTTEYYYKVLPVLPDKSWLLMIISKNERLNNRMEDLELFVNELI